MAILVKESIFLLECAQCWLQSCWLLTSVMLDPMTGGIPPPRPWLRVRPFYWRSKTREMFEKGELNHRNGLHAVTVVHHPSMFPHSRELLAEPRNEITKMTKSFCRKSSNELTKTVPKPSGSDCLGWVRMLLLAINNLWPLCSLMVWWQELLIHKDTNNYLIFLTKLERNPLIGEQICILFVPVVDLLWLLTTRTWLICLHGECAALLTDEYQPLRCLWTEVSSTSCLSI